MKTLKIRSLAAAWSAALLLGGCGLTDEIGLNKEEPWEPDASALQIAADGSVTETLLEKLDRDYYQGAEISAMVQEAVADYNREAGAERVSADPVLAGKTTVKVVLRYASGEDCAAFNRSVFFSGSMLDAEMAGYLFYQDFARVEKDGSIKNGISWEQVLSHKEYQVLVTDLTHVVRMPAKVKYVSANASVAEGKIVRPEASGTDSKEPEGLVLPSSAVYAGKGSSRQISEAEQEEAYLYIIYE